MQFQGHHSVHHSNGSSKESWYSYTCAHCGKQVSGAVVSYVTQDAQSIKWLWCTSCANGSVLTLEGNVYPGALVGPNIEGLPYDVEEAYQEARRCISVNAFTACELVCRKILMHVAAEKGAKEGEDFTTYLKYLETHGYITPAMKGWVDIIRQHGNKATHKLAAPDNERAESTLMFTAELLRIIYEMEYLAKRYVPKTS